MILMVRSAASRVSNHEACGASFETRASGRSSEWGLCETLIQMNAMPPFNMIVWPVM
jgi:hypothetical protein